MRSQYRGTPMPVVPVIAFALLVVACSPEIVEEPFEPRESHASYRDALDRLELAETELGQAWITAAERALDTPTSTVPPVSQVVFFDPARPDAVGYEFGVERGRRIEIVIDTEANRYFADVYRAAGDEAPTLVASRSPDGDRIVFEPRFDGVYILRLQPELLRGGRFEITLVARASLSFPVEGVGPEAILSFYGDGRDGGLRMHEGIDIFAPRGTNLLAASDSVVQRVGVRDRGGNVITLYDEARDLVLYYAHLEEQLVERGQRVRAGEAIGTMGNTGNAITTPPHLHIGLYQGSWRNDVDPWDYFVDPPLTDPPAVSDPDLVGQWLTLGRDATFAGALPTPRAEPRYVNRNPLLLAARSSEPDQASDSAADSPPVEPRSLPAGTAVRVLGASWNALDVETATGRRGVIEAEAVRGERETVELAGAVVLRDPHTRDVVAVAPAGTTLPLVGSAPGGLLVVEYGGRVVTAAR